MSKWISIKDKLPLYKECILFYSTDIRCNVTFGCYRGQDEDGFGFFTEYHGFRAPIGSVTHWMPLPEAPEVNNE